MEKKINLKAKNIWILLIIISLIIWAYFLFSNINRDKNLNHLLNNTWVSEEDKADLISDLDENKSISKEEIDKKIDNLKRKIKLKWLIANADMYYDENEYMIALIKYQQILKNIPDDEEINVKAWDINYKIHRYKKANEYYSKVKNSSFLDKDKAIMSLINDKWVNENNLEELTKSIEKFEISDEKKFYYTTSLVCVVDYSLCRDKYQKYFESHKDIGTEEMKVMKESLEAFKNFKDTDLYYKAAFVTWAFFQNWLYYISLKTSEWILNQRADYKPIMKVAAKSAYEVWDYISAKKYLTEIKKTENNNPEISYFLWRVFEKLNNKVPALVNYQKALKDWYKDILDIKRRIVFLYFESNETEKMLNAFNDLINTKWEKLDKNDYNLAIYYNILYNRLEKAKHYSELWIRNFKDTEIFYWYIAWIMLQDENQTPVKLRIIKSYIDKANEVDTKSPTILMVSWIYEMKIKNYDKASSILKNALINDKNWEYKETINFWIKEVNKEKNLQQINTQNGTN